MKEVIAYKSDFPTSAFVEWLYILLNSPSACRDQIELGESRGAKNKACSSGGDTGPSVHLASQVKPAAHLSPVQVWNPPSGGPNAGAA